MHRVEQDQGDATVNYKTCRCGKRGYHSRAETKAANKTNGARLRFYHCLGGNLWHATNDEKNKRSRHGERRRFDRSRRWGRLVADQHKLDAA